MPTRNGYPLLMKPSSNSTCSPLYHSERKRPGTSLSRVQFQKVAVLFTRCVTKTRKGEMSTTCNKDCFVFKSLSEKMRN